MLHCGKIFITMDETEEQQISDPSTTDVHPSEVTGLDLDIHCACKIND